MAEHCQCQSGTHGHKPGECENEATENDRMCKLCHDKAASDFQDTQGGPAQSMPPGR